MKREPPGDFSASRILMLSGQMVINDELLEYFCLAHNFYGGTYFLEQLFQSNPKARPKDIITKMHVAMTEM